MHTSSKSFLLFLHAVVVLVGIALPSTILIGPNGMFDSMHEGMDYAAQFPHAHVHYEESGDPWPSLMSADCPIVYSGEGSVWIQAANSTVNPLLCPDNQTFAVNGSTITLSGWTFGDHTAHSTHGTGDGKGAIVNAYRFNSKGSKVILRDCVFYDSHADSKGGSVYIDGGELVVDNCIFLRNTAQTDGSAIYAKDAIVTIVDSVFENCTLIDDETDNTATVTLENCDSVILNTSFYEIADPQYQRALKVDQGRAFIDPLTFVLYDAPSNTGYDGCASWVSGTGVSVAPAYEYYSIARIWNNTFGSEVDRCYPVTS